MSFNWDGSLFATTCKDKKVRVIDARSGEVVQMGEGHVGTKASRVTWCGTANMLFTTGFSKMSERQYSVWDPKDLSKPLKTEMIDTSSGVLFSEYDEDTNMIYVGGKVGAATLRSIHAAQFGITAGHAVTVPLHCRSRVLAVLAHISWYRSQMLG